MAQWIGRASQGHEMFCHYPGTVGSNPSPVERGVPSPSVAPKYNNYFTFEALLLLDILKLDNHITFPRLDV